MNGPPDPRPPISLAYHTPSPRSPRSKWLLHSLAFTLCGAVFLGLLIPMLILSDRTSHPVFLYTAKAFLAIMSLLFSAGFFVGVRGALGHYTSNTWWLLSILGLFFNSILAVPSWPC